MENIKCTSCDPTIIISFKWIKCSDKLPPKDTKFLFSYWAGIGLGQWGQCYTITNGHSHRTHEAYILILWPSEIIAGEDPFEWSEEYMIEMEVSWMSLPEPPNEL